MCPTFRRIPSFKKSSKKIFGLKSSKNKIGQKYPNVFCLFEALKCLFSKFGAPFIPSYITKIFHSFCCPSLIHFHACVWNSLPLLITMFVKLVLWLRYFDVIFIPNSSVMRQKGRISKRVFQEKARHVFFKHPFWDSPFYLITNELWLHTDRYIDF